MQTWGQTQRQSLRQKSQLRLPYCLLVSTEERRLNRKFGRHYFFSQIDLSLELTPNRTTSIGWVERPERGGPVKPSLSSRNTTQSYTRYIFRFYFIPSYIQVQMQKFLKDFSAPDDCDGAWLLRKSNLDVLCQSVIPKGFLTPLGRVGRGKIFLRFNFFLFIWSSTYEIWSEIETMQRFRVETGIARYRKYRGLSLIRWSFFHMVKSASVSQRTELHIQ